MSTNARTIAQLKKAADTLGQLAETLRNVSVNMEAAPQTPKIAAKKEVSAAPKKMAEVISEKKSPGRQAAPDVKFKMLKKHLGLGLGEFETEVRVVHPNISGAQMKSLREELRAAKAAAGIEVKRGPKPKAEVPEVKANKKPEIKTVAKKVETAPSAVKKASVKPSLTIPKSKKDAAGFEFFVH